MANICCVDHKVYLGADASNGEELQRFYSLLEQSCKSAKAKDISVLRHILTELYGEDVASSYSCRSEIDAIKWENGVIEIMESTAWSPCESAWNAVLGKFQSLSHAWVVAEPGCRLYRKVDEDNLFDQRTYVVFSDAVPDSDWEFGVEYSSQVEWRKALEELCGEPFDEGLSLEELLDRAHTVVTGKRFYFEAYSYDTGCEKTDWSRK